MPSQRVCLSEGYETLSWLSCFSNNSNKTGSNLQEKEITLIIQLFCLFARWLLGCCFSATQRELEGVLKRDRESM